MCTVTFLPGPGGVQLTSNRDEHISRGRALRPEIYNGESGDLLYPKDADKQGSWIVARDNGDAAVLLNGAFVKHLRMGSYRRSRGVILLELMGAELPLHHFQVMDLSDIEPFTLILYQDRKLFECRWDSSQKSFVRLDTSKPYIWSSATLYSDDAVSEREKWFGTWYLDHLVLRKGSVTDFHLTTKKEDRQNGLVIDRDGVMRTVSVTSICIEEKRMMMEYHDLQDNTMNTSILARSGSVAPLRNGGPLPWSVGLRSFFIRLFNWEYWPFHVTYLALMPYWFWLGMKARSLFFFSAANPGIENGGFAMESKMDVYGLIPPGLCPKTVLIRTDMKFYEIFSKVKEEGFAYPLIVKPDIGQRGIKVAVVANESQLKAYALSSKVDFLIQEHIPYKNEAGIFYYRIPGEKNGHISGIVGKEFLHITGDGRSTTEQLLLKVPRYLLQLSALSRSGEVNLQEVLPTGKKVTLVPFGNHSRGAKFLDLSHLISHRLTESLNKVLSQVPGFYYGRLDIMYDNWEDLTNGQKFSIVELNGAGSEPTHIYDPSHSILFAWKEIIRHWDILFLISKYNKEREHIPYMTYREGLSLLQREKAYSKLLH